MVENGGIIAGSFALQVLFNEEYSGSDIDIFFSNETFKDFDTYIQSLNPIVCAQRSSQEDHVSVLKSNVFYLNNAKINTIVINGNLQDHFNKFDLTFCNTQFDGTNLTFFPETLLKKGKINTEDSFFGSYRYDFYKTSNETLSDEELLQLYLKELSMRILKYKVRGFEVENIDVMKSYKNYNSLIGSISIFEKCKESFWDCTVNMIFIETNFSRRIEEFSVKFKGFEFLRFKKIGWNIDISYIIETQSLSFEMIINRLKNIGGVITLRLKTQPLLLCGEKSFSLAKLLFFMSENPFSKFGFNRYSKSDNFDGQMKTVTFDDSTVEKFNSYFGISINNLKFCEISKILYELILADSGENAEFYNEIFTQLDNVAKFEPQGSYTTN